MSTLSIPIDSKIQDFIHFMIDSGRFENKAAVVRQALRKMAEDEAVEAVLRSMQEAKEGKVLRGDLRELMKQIH